MPIHIPHSSYRHKKTIRSASIAPLKIPQLIEYFGPVIPLDFLGYFLLNPHSEACIGSFPVPPDSYDTLQHRISGSKKPLKHWISMLSGVKSLISKFRSRFHQIKDLGKLCISPARRIKDTGRALFLRCCCLLCRYLGCEVLFLLLDTFADFETNYLCNGKFFVHRSQVLGNSLLAIFCSDISLV